MARQRRFHFSIKYSIGGAMVGAVLFTALLIGTVAYLSIRVFIFDDIRARLRSAVGIAALQVDAGQHATIKGKEDESGENHKQLKRILQNIRKQDKDLRFVYTMKTNAEGKFCFIVDAESDPKEMSHPWDVYDSPTQVLRDMFKPPYVTRVETGFSTDKWGTWLSGFAPVLAADGSLECILGMDISAKRIIDYQRRYLLNIALICGIVCLFGAVLGVLLSGNITRPLLSLEKDMSEIREFKLDSVTEVKSGIVEIRRMKTAVDNMKSGLRSFRKYVPADLVRQLVNLGKEAVLEAERRELSIFFSDIKDFTTISEQLAPEKLIEDLGVYFSRMTGIIMQREGTVDKYIGDAIMAFWGAPLPVADHAAKACRTALACQEFLGALNRDRAKQGKPLLETRIGLNTGEVLVGNMGYEQRLNYTIIGDHVNLASRLEAMNKYYGTKILMSEFIHERVKDVMETRQLDIVAVKGKALGVGLFELVAEKDNINAETAAFLARHDAAFALYRKGAWAEAEAAFRELAVQYPDDGPVRVLLKRVTEFRANPPHGFDGVLRMHEK